MSNFTSNQAKRFSQGGLFGLLLTASLLLASCGGGGGGGSGQATYSVGGTVSGLNSAASIVLLDNNADALTISANGPFIFSTPLAGGANYQVTIGTAPPGQQCTVSNGGPQAISANVTNIQVACTTATVANVVAEHALAQTGLAIALASTVLQSQVQIIITSLAASTNCSVLTGGGSVQGDPTAKTVTVYYDAACSQRYIVANPVITQTTTSDGPQFTVVEAATYYGPGGAAIGAMSLNETATNITATNTLQVHGTGDFTPAGAAPTPVQLGLYCSVPNFITTGPVPSPETVSCGGAVAQDFPALNLAIGAVTPMTLSIAMDATTGAPTNVSFTGGGSAVTGPLGSLTLTNPSPSSLVINGGSDYTTTTASGGAAAFALFPPTPTSWNLTDGTNDEQLQISVVDNTTRDSSMTIAQTSTGNSLATATLDQSGTGTITYSDGSTAAVTNWTLAD